MAKITGLTSNTPKNLLLGAGAFFKNYDVTTDTPATAATKLIGATQGGGTFSAVPTVRQIAVDGSKTNVKGLQTIDEWVVTMTANVKEVTADSIVLALGAGTKASSTTPAGTKVTANDDISDDDYIDNITWIGSLNDGSKMVAIVLKNGLSINGLTVTPADKNEAVIPVTITGNYDLDDLDTAPFEIYFL